MTNTSALRDAIERKGVKYGHIAKEMGLSPYGLQRKIENDNEFKVSEVCRLSDILGLDPSERDSIFFAK